MRSAACYWYSFFVWYYTFLCPYLGVTGAVSKLTLGLRNTLDSKEKLKADAKYKSNDENNNNKSNNYYPSSRSSNNNDTEEVESDDAYFFDKTRTFQVFEDYNPDT